MGNRSLKENRRHGDVSLPISCYRISPPMDDFWQLECHWHDEMELFCVKHGRVQVQCGNFDFEAQAGDLIFFNSGELHAARTLDSAKLDYTAIVFSPELLCADENDISRIRYVAPVIDGSLKVRRVVHEDEKEGKLLCEFAEAAELLSKRPAAYELRVRARLLDIFAELAGDGEKNGIDQETSSQHAIKAAIDYIRKNYGSRITTEELARVSNMSDGHFCRLFKKFTFKTPVQYINNVRLSAATELLLHTDRKVLDIALSTGFNSLSYFIGVFKENLGRTPTEFRGR